MFCHAISRAASLLDHLAVCSLGFPHAHTDHSPLYSPANIRGFNNDNLNY